MVLFISVSEWDGGLDRELAVIGDLMSIACFYIVGRGVRSIGTLFEVSSLFRSFLSTAPPPLTVFSLSFPPSHLSCSISRDFPLQLEISLLGPLTIVPSLCIPLRTDFSHLAFCSPGSVSFFGCAFSSRCKATVCCHSVRFLPVVTVLGRCL